MTKTQLLEALSLMSKEEEEEWMFALGAALTISARDAYVPGEIAADAEQLIGYNELQHQIFGRRQAFKDKREWTAESFVDALMYKALVYRIEGGLGRAAKSTLQTKLRAPAE